MTSARDLAVQCVADAMIRGNAVHGDPDDIKGYAEIAVDALLAYGPRPDGPGYQAGWLFAYGRLHEVAETDSQDYGYFAYTRDPDDDEENED